VGIDPSINSTGVCIQLCNENAETIKTKFFIVKGGKLSKKELQAESENAERFEYVLYDKTETKTSENNHEFEYIKTRNFYNIVNEVYGIVSRFFELNDNPEDPIQNVWVCQEGISYGSTLRTKSIFDLAGLNYMLRMKFIRHDDLVTFIIGTPGEIKKFATGAGNANKDLVISVFKASYPELTLPKIDDVADAFFMSKYAKHLYEKS
jgi:hypothetical protein